MEIDHKSNVFSLYLLYVCFGPGIENFETWWEKKYCWFILLNNTTTRGRPIIGADIKHIDIGHFQNIFADIFFL